MTSSSQGTHIGQAANEYSVNITPGCGSCFRSPWSSLSTSSTARGKVTRRKINTMRATGEDKSGLHTAYREAIRSAEDDDDDSLADSTGPFTRTTGSDPGSCSTPKMAVRLPHGGGRVERHSSMPEVNCSPSDKLVLRHNTRGVSAELFESGTTPMTAKSELLNFNSTLKTPLPSPGVLRELEMELLRAVRAGDHQRVSKLLKLGCRPNPEGASGPPTASFLLESNQPQVSLLLLEAGADVNAVRPSDGDTPLMQAVRRGDLQMVRLLLGEPKSYGARIRNY
ncbi:hypothetical protein FOL47_009447 [Perkinsus chesapeaki]|uniref:Ankyrin Repeat Protein n=1 Tax=Perkinsus chesapeaki TaxID=330153 RepID=A0A7J6MSC0_PERCH|nr:hypothetical protein FOL47_009447 [Perkinsus chesapeaki]